MNEEKAVTAFAALSNKARLRILKALVQAGPNGLPAGEIATLIEASPSRASFHLSNLADAGLVTQEKHARTITYKVAFADIGQLVLYLMQDCCAGHPAVVNCG